MKNKDIKLFDFAIHQLKAVACEIKAEKDKYHNELEKMKDEHDAEMNKLIKELMTVLDGVNELFIDLYNGNNSKNNG